MIQEILRRSKEEIKIISIRLGTDSDGFYCGYVKDFNESFVILQHFTKFGKHDGLMIEKLENIVSIEFEDEYTRAMAYIIENNILLDFEDNVHVALNDSENWAHEFLAPLSKKDDLMAAIQINSDSFYTGLLLDVSAGHVMLNLIGKDGQDEGKSIYKLEDITSIRLNDIEDRRRLILYRWRLSRK